MSKEVTVTMKIESLGDDPPISTFHVTLSSTEGVWTERFGSRNELNAFQRGLKALASYASVVIVWEE